MKTLPEYLNYLRTTFKAGEQVAGTPVSIALFRDYAAQAFMSARDGNDYAVFPEGDKFTVVVVGNNCFTNDVDTVNGQGCVNVLYTVDTLQDAMQEIIQVMIYDNDLNGVYESNNHI